MSVRVTAVGEQTSLADRKRRAGQRLILGLAGPLVDDDLRYLVREIRPAGFILFSRNVEEPAQVLELNRELASLVDPGFPAILSVDQEGGRVQRVREPATCWPSMRAVGNAGTYTQDMSAALALELRAMGFHLNFAPVADVDSNPDNPVIGDRAFSAKPEDVAHHVQEFIAGHHRQGVATCAKHFPGHGDTQTDSHLELPVVEEELPRLLTRELVPFEAAVQAKVGAIMSAHVMFPVLDEALPATLSPHVIPHLLRDRLGFDGVVISDDMEMKAVHGRWPVAVQAEAATRATVDVMLCCKAPELQMNMFQALVRIQEEDPGLETLSIDSVRRIQRLRERFLLEPEPLPALSCLGSSEHRLLAANIRLDGGA